MSYHFKIKLLNDNIMYC